MKNQLLKISEFVDSMVDSTLPVEQQSFSFNALDLSGGKNGQCYNYGGLPCMDDNEKCENHNQCGTINKRCIFTNDQCKCWENNNTTIDQCPNG